MSPDDVRKLVARLRQWRGRRHTVEQAYDGRIRCSDCQAAADAMDALADVVEAAQRVPNGLQSPMVIAALQHTLARLEALKP